MSGNQGPQPDCPDGRRNRLCPLVDQCECAPGPWSILPEAPGERSSDEKDQARPEAYRQIKAIRTGHDCAQEKEEDLPPAVYGAGQDQTQEEDFPRAVCGAGQGQTQEEDLAQAAFGAGQPGHRAGVAVR